MKSIFCAIAYGSTDAKVFIPYILQLPDLRTKESTEIFNKEINMVPEWMFLPYVSQILSSYDFENESYLDELLLKLATKYPNGELFFKKITFIFINFFFCTQQSTSPSNSHAITTAACKKIVEWRKKL